MDSGGGKEQAVRVGKLQGMLIPRNVSSVKLQLFMMLLLP